jgi:hypothetical protein
VNHKSCSDLLHHDAELLDTDSVRRAAIALYNPKQDTFEAWKSIREPGSNEQEIDTKFRGIEFRLLLAASL